MKQLGKKRSHTLERATKMAEKDKNNATGNDQLHQPQLVRLNDKMLLLRR